MTLMTLHVHMCEYRKTWLSSQAEVLTSKVPCTPDQSKQLLAKGSLTIKSQYIGCLWLKIL